MMLVMKKLKIEKNVPMPRRRSVYNETFAVMDVGDSFVLPLNKRPSVVTAARRHKKQNPAFGIATRTVGDGQVRVWRVS